MISIPRLCFLCIVGLGLGFTRVDSSASEPSVYSKMLTPSPLGNDRILAICVLEQGGEQALAQFYDGVDWNAYSDRHLTAVEISKRAVHSVYGNKGDDLKGLRNKARHEDFGNQLRRKANCKDDFEFVLIGKDMGVKKRWARQLPQGELFQLIDAMPMRRYEMKQKLEKY